MPLSELELLKRLSSITHIFVNIMVITIFCICFMYTTVSFIVTAPKEIKEISVYTVSFTMVIYKLDKYRV